MDSHSCSYTQAFKHTCRTVLKLLFCWQYICGPDVDWSLVGGAARHRMFCIPPVVHVRRSSNPSVWLHLSVCHGDLFASAPLLASSRGLGMSVCMLMWARCGMLNQVLRGNSGPFRRKTQCALCYGRALYTTNSFKPNILWCRKLHFNITIQTNDIGSSQTHEQWGQINTL